MVSVPSARCPRCGAIEGQRQDRNRDTQDDTARHHHDRHDHRGRRDARRGAVVNTRAPSTWCHVNTHRSVRRVHRKSARRLDAVLAPFGESRFLPRDGAQCTRRVVTGGYRMDDVVRRFVDPDRIASRAEVLATPSPVPARGGVYGWWFRTMPTVLDTTRCHHRNGLTLLYVGISPQAPPKNGRGPSRQTLQRRIRSHYAGNAEASTLRLTLGCLLADPLGIRLTRVGTGDRFTFHNGEPKLSEWMGENAFVSWMAADRPWEIEDELIATLDLPLNLRGNSRHLFHRELSQVRSAAIRGAKALPILANPGVGGRFVADRDRADRFVAQTRGATDKGKSSLARLVLIGAAANVDRGSIDDARSMLRAALQSLRAAGGTVGIVVTPAGFVDHKPGGSWRGLAGWQTPQGDFDELATVASSVAKSLMTPELRRLAAGVVDHFVIGIDVWPTSHREPHAEVACLYDVSTESVRPVTGKSYPTSGQQRNLIRNANHASHVVDVGTERLAILVCHDLAAWSARGNAVATGVRAATWRAMRTAVSDARPTLAIHLPHTVDKAGTWRQPWREFGAAAGPSLRAGTTAIRHLDKDYHSLPGPFDAALLDGTGWGGSVIDILVGAPLDVSGVTLPIRPAATLRAPLATTPKGPTTPISPKPSRLDLGPNVPEHASSSDRRWLEWARGARTGEVNGALGMIMPSWTTALARLRAIPLRA